VGGGVAVTDFVRPLVSDSSLDDRLNDALLSLVQQALSEHGWIRLHLRGDSMWPTIPAGNLVEVERVVPDAVRPGDIVLSQRAGALVAHRVVQRARENGEELLVTKGDNCSSSDKLLAPASVIGRVSTIYRGDDAVAERAGRSARSWAAFWLWRWRIRSSLDRAGRLLPRGVQWPLIRVRNSIGACLSHGFRLAFLR
jgi:signal peptidase I